MYVRIACLAALLLLLSGLLPAKAQDFYMVAPENTPPGNRTYRLSLDSCNPVPIHTCPPTNNTTQYFENFYADIAIDKDSSLWYISGWSSLYKGSLRDTACRFVGKLESATVNAMVVDTAGNLYLAGNMNGVCALYKYDTGFHILGYFPPGIFSSGDLFFYENRLFMSSSDALQKMAFLTEVSLPDPQKSCYYMSLGDIPAYGAFSTRSGDGTRAFVVLTVGSAASVLVELDIPNRKRLSNLCTYPFPIMGAAAWYDRTADSATCIPLPVQPTSVAANQPAADFITILQPAADRILVQTNIDASQISSLGLFDVSGRRVKEFSAVEFPNAMDISELPEGIYILQLSTRKGQVLREKVIRTSSR